VDPARRSCTSGRSVFQRRSKIPRKVSLGPEVVPRWCAPPFGFTRGIRRCRAQQPGLLRWPYGSADVLGAGGLLPARPPVVAAAVIAGGLLGTRTTSTWSHSGDRRRPAGALIHAGLEAPQAALSLRKPSALITAFTSPIDSTGHAGLGGKAPNTTELGAPMRRRPAWRWRASGNHRHVEGQQDLFADAHFQQGNCAALQPGHAARCKVKRRVVRRVAFQIDRLSPWGPAGGDRGSCRPGLVVPPLKQAGHRAGCSSRAPSGRARRVAAAHGPLASPEGGQGQPPPSHQGLVRPPGLDYAGAGARAAGGWKTGFLQHRFDRLPRSSPSPMGGAIPAGSRQPGTEEWRKMLPAAACRFDLRRASARHETLHGRAWSEAGPGPFGVPAERRPRCWG